MRSLMISVLLVSLLIAGCSFMKSDPVLLEGVAFHSMPWAVKVDRLPSGMDQQSMQQKLQLLLDEINSTLSTYQDNTELMRFNQAPVGEWVTVSPRLMTAVSKAVEVSKESQGRYDITIAPLVNLWGFGPEARPLSIPSEKAIAEARAKVGWQKLKIDEKRRALLKEEKIKIDLSSVGEGVAVDALSEQLLAWGVKGFMVSVAGCTRVQGVKADGKPWVIAIEKPDGSGEVQQILSLNNRVISTSGSYRNYYEKNGVRYSHTIDPATGYPIRHKGVSVSVVMAGDTTLADAWATALNVLGPDEGYRLAEQRGMAAYFIRHTERGPEVRYTKAFQVFLPK